MTPSAAPKQVLEGALTWIDGHLPHFDPFKDGELTGLCEIPLSELAILTLSAQRCSRPVDTAVTTRFLDLLESTHHKPLYQERPFREPETLVSHLVVAVALERGGRLDGCAFLASIEQLIEASTLTAPALPPHRMMELRHALDLGQVGHGLPSYLTLYRSTMPARPVNPIYVSRAEAYILTHVIFYAADLGFRSPEGICAGERKRLAKLVERLLGMYIVARNWDLTAELILSALCLRNPCAFNDVGWQCLVSAQRADGAVPGTRGRPKEAAMPTTPEDIDADVGSCYHTTLVSALAALSALHIG
ncbi:DUF6895 family protein [Streptomyces sp. H39-S7]|uniref:DUF6895 family protein n=1 Tax=Streptomyces sp. H39-S7 TaxID=3004357 RepID=UPI0022AECE15|nr:hypothetical protein [Streptomyces sp. H39-S7]MCZ4126095.1 hypothetical protein [Streptomyces sp. H39-S7]